MSESLLYDSSYSPFETPGNRPGDGRDLFEYENQFGRDALFSEGSVLDIGSGNSEFGTAVINGVTIYRLDPQYRDSPPGNSARAIIALAEDIPLPDKSVDRVLFSWSLFHITDHEPRAKAYAEAMRVARRSVSIHPLFINPVEGDKFFPLPGFSSRRYTGDVTIPFPGIEQAMTLELDIPKLDAHIAGRFDYARVSEIVARKYATDTFQYLEDVLALRLKMKALLA